MNSYKFQKDLRIFGYLWLIQFRFWSENIINLFLGIGISLYTMICWLAFKSGDPFLLVSGISVGIIRNGMYIYQKTMIDWKKNGTMDRFEVLPIPKYIRTSAFVSFNFVSTFAIALFMFAVAMAFFPMQRTLVTKANGWMVFSGFLLTWLISLVVGTFIYLYVKKPAVSQTIGILIYATSLYFLGLSFPIELILDPRWAWFGDVLYLWPHRYALNIVQAGFANVNQSYQLVNPSGDGIHFIWQITSDSKYTGIMNIVNYPIFDSFQEPVYITNEQGQMIQKSVTVDLGFAGKAWIAYLCAIGVIVIYGSLAGIKISKNTKFHEKNEYGNLVVNQTSSKYIYKIKNAKNIDDLILLHRIRTQELINRSDLTKKAVKKVQRQIKSEQNDEKQR